MKRAILVANPAASQFTGALHRTTVRALARRYDVEAVWPESALEAQAIAGGAAIEGADLVVAMGGDGIVHHVAQGLVGTETPLGIVPAGTTNVLARILGIPHRPAAAARSLAGGFAVRSAPVVTVDAETADGRLQRSALFALGIGLDAAIVAEAEAEPYRKYRFGALHYARTAFAVVRRRYRGRPPTARVRAEERSADAIGVMVQLHPVITYLGPLALRLSPAEPDPLTVLCIRQVRLRRSPAILRGAATDAGLGVVPGFEVWDGASRVSVVADPPLLAQADGEIFGPILRLEAGVRPAAIRYAVPPR